MNNESNSEEELDPVEFKKFLSTYFISRNKLDKRGSNDNYANFKRFFKNRKEFFKTHPPKDNKLLYDQIFNYIVDIFNNAADKVLGKSNESRRRSNLSSLCETRNVNIRDVEIDDCQLNLRTHSSEQDNFPIDDDFIIEENDQGAEQSTKEFLMNFPDFLNFTHLENDDFNEVVDSSNSVRPIDFNVLQAQIAATLNENEGTNSFSAPFSVFSENIKILHSRLHDNNATSHKDPDKLVLPDYQKFIKKVKIPAVHVPRRKFAEIWKDYEDNKKPNYLEQDLTVYICNYVNTLAVLPPFEDGSISNSNNIRNQSKTIINTAEFPSTSHVQSSVQDDRDSREEYQSNNNASLPFTKSTPIVNQSSNIFTPDFTTSTSTARVKDHTKKFSTPFQDQLSRNFAGLQEDILEMSDISSTDQTIVNPTELLQPIIQNDLANEEIQPIAQTDPISMDELRLNLPSNDTEMIRLTVDRNSDLRSAPIESNCNQTGQINNAETNTENENNQLITEPVPLESNILNANGYRTNWFNILRSRNDIQYYDSNETSRNPVKRRKRKKITVEPNLPNAESVVHEVPVISEAYQPTMTEQTAQLQENMAMSETYEELIAETNFPNWKNDFLEAAKQICGLSEPKLMTGIEQLEEDYAIFGQYVCEILSLGRQKPFVTLDELNSQANSSESAALRFKLLIDLNGRLIDLSNKDGKLGYSLRNL